MANKKEFTAPKERDLTTALQELYHEQGLFVRFEVHVSVARPDKYWLEVQTWEMGEERFGHTSYRTRHELSLRDPNRILQQMLRAAYDHWARLESDPWNLPRKRRRELTGEDI